MDRFVSDPPALYIEPADKLVEIVYSWLPTYFTGTKGGISPSYLMS